MHESGSAGTTRTYREVGNLVAFGGQSGHQPVIAKRNLCVHALIDEDAPQRILVNRPTEKSIEGSTIPLLRTMRT